MKKPSPDATEPDDLRKDEDDALDEDESAEKGSRDELDDDDDADDNADDDADDSDDDVDDDQDDSDDDEPPSRRSKSKPWETVVVPTLFFVAAVALLDTALNLRYPLDEAAFWYLLPSVDVAVVVLNLTIMGLLRARVPAWLRWGIVAWVLIVRLLRVGDGIKGRYFAQRFNLYTDVALIPDGIRFLHSTRPWWQLVGGGLLAVAAFVGLALACHWAVRVIERYVAERRHVTVAAGLAGACYFGVTTIPHSPRYDAFYSGGFAASAVSRVDENIRFFWNVRGQQSAYATLIAETQTMLTGLPSDLAKLGGANVYLILIESYGIAMFDWPPLAEPSSATFDAFEREVGAAGFTIATGTLTSSTYGGQSWFAHATLNTAVRVEDQLQYEILSTKAPLPMARFFQSAGYRTVVVQPNSTRDWAAGDFYQFEQKYYHRQLGYRGPAYAWAMMPDQFVLDVVRRRELDRRSRPLFIEYVLVSSHAPWSALPALVDDWSTLGDGSIYHRVPTQRFPIEWPNFERATEPYRKSIVYDFEVLSRYLRSYVADGSLVILLGDHQPVREVNGDSWDYRVPVHVLSRNPALVQPFVSRGYRPGMRPDLAAFAQGLESFFPNFLVDFSTERPPPNR